MTIADLLRGTHSSAREAWEGANCDVPHSIEGPLRARSLAQVRGSITWQDVSMSHVVGGLR